MGTRFHIGAEKLRSDLAAYAKRFDLLEVALAEKGSRTGPSLATLRRWRRSVPPHFAFTVVVGPNVGRLKASEAFEAELAEARAAVDALEARCVLVPTPAEVTPSKVWRDRMVRLVDRLPSDATQVIWEPRGVWEIDDAAVAAKKWGVVLAVDAAREPVPAGPVAYVRLRSMGESRSFGATALERVVGAIGVRRDAYVVLQSPGALAECKRLRRIAQSARSPKGAGGRVIRPRATTHNMRVRDDEQE
jgi:uncharacterized protein YecE (DUF72 family)